jgi:hypothetical protein
MVEWLGLQSCEDCVQDFGPAHQQLSWRDEVSLE